MIAVGFVLSQQFPVGSCPVPEPSGGEFDAAIGGQPHQPVDFAGGGAEVLCQRGTVGSEAAEHKALVRVDSRHSPEGKVELALAVALEERETDQFAVVAIRPTVVRAAKCRRAALGVVAYLVAPMCAAVQQEVQNPVAAAGHDDVLQPEAFSHVVAGLGHFGLMTDENPAAIPDLAEFLGKDRRVGVQRAVHLVTLDQPVIPTAGAGDLVGDRGHGRPPCPLPKIGRRFSRNAATPSAKSSVSKSSDWHTASRSSSSSGSMVAGLASNALITP